jgi:penicillin-binding protein 1C
LDTPLELPFGAAAKTGTSRHFTDNWAVVVTGGFTVAAWVGDFSGRPMEGVSGVTGAAPLMHRAALLVARRYAPGSLRTPRDAGAVPVRICRVSGLVASEHCPPMTEWAQPGRAPARTCDWHREDGPHLPAEYAEWSPDWQEERSSVPMSQSVARRSTTNEPRRAGGRTEPLRIVSPLEGDRYRIPPGIPDRYATLPLRASAAGAVRWFVDGKGISGGRWPLEAGAHVVRAETDAGEREEVSIEVFR